MLAPTRRRSPHSSPAPTGGEWSRQKLLAVLAGISVLGVAVLVGAAAFVWFRVHSQNPTGASAVSSGPPPLPRAASGAESRSAGDGSVHAGDSLVQARRDAAAAAPMRVGGPGQAQPAVLSVRDPGAIDLPPSTTAGPAGVPAGFPHTPAGALAQLVAIDTDVLNTATLDRARQVIGVWSAPGGPDGQSWSAVRALAGFHSAAGLSGGPTPGLSMRATAMMGQVKATDGPDWVVVCVDFEVDATLVRTARVAAADCQRMAWDGNRWLIGPGAEPAAAPSIWPGTDAAIDAGYASLRHE